MHAGRKYSLGQTLYWSRKSIYIFLMISTIPVTLYQVFGFTQLTIPWVPIALIGTAVAFYLGFKNNSSYERLWEARKIWGAIVNSSRSWGMMVLDFINDDFADTPLDEEALKKIHTRLVYRHVAWLRALDCQLRARRDWEHYDSVSQQYRKTFGTASGRDTENEITSLLPREELVYVMKKKNPAAQIVRLQSRELADLKARGHLNDFRHLEMERLLIDLYTQQGKSERIKNYPFPRQYASMNLFFVWLFVLLLPFGMIGEFSKLGEHFVWLSIPFSTIVAWVFHTMEMIGDFSENPFEGLYNDVPITALSRTIEIDLRDMLDEEDLPEPIKPVTEYKILI